MGGCEWGLPSNGVVEKGAGGTDHIDLLRLGSRETFYGKPGISGFGFLGRFNNLSRDWQVFCFWGGGGISRVWMSVFARNDRPTPKSQHGGGLVWRGEDGEGEGERERNTPGMFV